MVIGLLNILQGSTKMRDKNSISRVTLAEQIEAKKKNVYQSNGDIKRAVENLRQRNYEDISHSK